MKAVIDILQRLHQDASAMAVLVLASEQDAQRVAQSVLSLGRDFLDESQLVYVPCYFQTGVYRYESARRVIAARLAAAWQMTKQAPRVVVCTAAGLARGFPTADWTVQHSLKVSQNEALDSELLLEELESRAYRQAQRVEEVGEYAVRGALVDLWTPGEKTPVRLEFFDEQVEHIRAFSVDSQRSFESRQQVVILPAREFVWPPAPLLEKATETFNRHILQQGLMGSARVNLLEDLQSRVPFAGIDDVFYLFAEEPLVSLQEALETLAHQRERTLSWHVLSETALTTKSLDDLVTLYEGARAAASSKNLLCPKWESVFPGYTSVRGAFSAPGVLPSGAPIFHSSLSPQEAWEQALTALSKEKLPGRIKGLLQLKEGGYGVQNVVFCCQSTDSFLPLANLLEKHIPGFQVPEVFDTPFSASNLWEPVTARPVTARPVTARPAAVQPVTARPVAVQPVSVQALGHDFYYASLKLEEPFYLAHSKALFIGESWVRGSHHAPAFEHFGAEGSGSTSQPVHTLLSTQFADFAEGDPVVHVQHGIARFRGLMTITVADMSGDFLVLEFQGSDKIYVPVNKLNLIQRYLGSKDSVALDSLKSTAWEKRKEKARKDIEKVAKDLMEHQAKRALTPGHAFGKPDEDDLAFGDAFPFDETPDQLRAINEILADMSQPKAMDRLLCGDVGFGKTEVAMRAAYRCVLEGKQVAWLVPTTVLAHQHNRSLQERFAAFGVRVALLDRSVGASKVLAALKDGQTDIVIGTHRLLSPDVAFRDLGLLVVDEEQRFGVLQKEKIKSLSYGIDVLTMTATPIPRTLQLVMIGLRELSLLNTPPKARLATKTFVCPFDDDVIKDAVTFEMSRGGQLFYVHNRVEELGPVQAYIAGLVPKARICIAHGKMAQKDLEKTILDFLDEKYDILLCTTIVESGIDMPNVNTILIQNADQFGLAQLYQLRGRVGRRSTRGLAYFLTSPSASKNEEGLKRLEILKEHQDLGAGFVIASHDLELRGGGNILGDEQSGEVNDVGLETYMNMLDEAIKGLKGLKIKPTTDVDMQIPLQAQIPESYIENPKERLRTYRRFFGARQESVLEGLLTECEDRFGKPPEDVVNLAQLARIRRLLMELGAAAFLVGADSTELRFQAHILQGENADQEAFIKRIFEVCNHRVKRMRMTPDGRLLLPIAQRDFQSQPIAAINEVKRILNLLCGERYGDDIS